jgi:hypothetical protein
VRGGRSRDGKERLRLGNERRDAGLMRSSQFIKEEKSLKLSG